MSSSGTCISTSGTLRFFFFLGLSFLPQPNILSPLVLLRLADLWPFLCDDAHRKSINPVSTIVVMPMALVPSRYKRSFRVTSDSGFVSLGRIPDSAALDSSDTCPPVLKHPTIGMLPPSACSGDILCDGEMLVVRTIEDTTNPIGKFVCSKHSIGLDHFSLAVHPLGLNGVQPRALLGQKTAHDPNPFATLFDLSVVFAEPSPHLLGDVPTGVVPDQK